MTGAGAGLQAAVVAALRRASVGAIYDGPPLQAAFPHAVVEFGPETDWSHKSGQGREVRLAITVKDKGERPGRLHGLMDAAAAAIGSLGPIGGWQLVTMQFLRSRAVKEPGGSWAGVIEFRARMLATGG